MRIEGLQFVREALLTLVQAIKRHRQSASINCNGVATLANISCCLIDDYKPDINEGGCLKCAIWAKRHVAHSPVQRDGCILLIGNLFTHPMLRQGIVDKGGHKAVINARKHCKQSALVQHHECRALNKLLHDESPTWAKAATDLSGPVISAMETHLNDFEIQYTACLFLTSLSNANDDYRNMVLDADGLVPVVRALRVHKDNAPVKHAARMAFDAMISR
jgi:hypothetical protein